MVKQVSMNSNIQDKLLRDTLKFAKSMCRLFKKNLLERQKKKKKTRIDIYFYWISIT